MSRTKSTTSVASAKVAQLRTHLRFLEEEEEAIVAVQRTQSKLRRLRLEKELLLAEADLSDDSCEELEPPGDAVLFNRFLSDSQDRCDDLETNGLDLLAEACEKAAPRTLEMNSAALMQVHATVSTPQTPPRKAEVRNLGTTIPAHQPTPSAQDQRCETPDAETALDQELPQIVNNRQPLNVEAPEFRSHKPSEDLNNNSIVDVVNTLADHLDLSRLPPPEPPVFTGDPLLYPNWLSAFETLVERRGLPPRERMHYLRRYLGGNAREVVEGYFLLPDDSAYEDAKALLKERFGDPFLVADAFRNKLESWPRVAARDGRALRRLADFLRQCEAAMKSIGNLAVLDDDRENRKILTKLPDWLVNRWGRIVEDWAEKQKKFPPFTEFSKFITKEARIQCNPMMQSLRDNQQKPNPGRSEQRHSGRHIGAQSHNTQGQDEAEKRPPTGASGTDRKKKGQKGTSHQVKPESAEIKCSACQGPHTPEECPDLLGKSLSERKDLIRRERLCFGCLRKGHRSKFCRQRLTCKVCDKAHPTLLHGDLGGRAAKDGDSPQSSSPGVETGVNHCNSNRITGPRLNAMIVPVMISHRDRPDQKEICYALLDSQSSVTLALDRTIRGLGIRGIHTKLALSTMTSQDQLIETERIEGLMVQGLGCDKVIPLPTTYTRTIMPVDRAHIPTPETAQKWEHLKRIKDELHPLQDVNVGLLIGYNCSRALLPREVICGLDGDPFAQRTDLGWGIVGLIEEDEIGNSHQVVIAGHRSPQRSSVNGSQSGYASCHQIAICMSNNFKEVISTLEFDFNESRPSLQPQPYSVEDREFLTKIEKGIHQRTDGHYEMPLPFRGKPPTLQNNRSQVLKRLHQIKRKMETDAEYRRHYQEFMQRIIKEGDAERVPPEKLCRDDGHAWYLPHFGVYHPQKPSKIRIVFDASARYFGYSLNDFLLQGPDLMNSLVGILIRFRQEPIAVTCDVKCMFHQFKVDESDRDYLRFLWWPEGDLEKDPVDYRMRVHLFGAKSSPACCSFGLKQIANDYENEFGQQAAEFLRRNVYVDDGIGSLPTVPAATELLKATKEMCSKGGLHLHKINSNSPEVLQSIPIEDRSECSSKVDELPTPGGATGSAHHIERALGVHWAIEVDMLKFRIVLKDRPLTRRGVLSTIGSIYDPLGMAAPVLLIGKRILQELCKEKAEWDTPLPDEVAAKWEKWRSDLPLLEQLEIPRCYRPENFKEVKRAELHYLSDASAQGLGHCTYIRFINHENQVHCALLMGKSRVAPIRPVTIPRLELAAALISVRISSQMGKELDFKIASETFWTDSKVVLGYVANESRRFHVFVANRVAEIRDHTKPSQWRYVRSEDNVADEASRGLHPRQLVEGTAKWFKGPDFLWKRELPEDDYPEKGKLLCEEDPEVRKVETLVTTVGNTPIVDRLSRFSSWSAAKTAVALIRKYRERLLARINKTDIPSASLQAADLESAEVEIIKMVQSEAFREEIDILRKLNCTAQAINIPENARERNKKIKATSSLYRLDPFIDKDGVLRVGGRIRRADVTPGMKHPAILPKRSHVTSLVVRHHHNIVAHQGRGMTVNSIRQSGLWVINCRAAVQSYIYDCVTCHKLRSPTTKQKMADLPRDRLQPSPAFTFVGVDVFGPFIIKEGRKEQKRYGVLYTCLVMRAIHVEVINAMTTDAFINSLRRFLAIRGPIKRLRCDQGTNFVGAERELKEAWDEIDSESVKRFLLSQGADFVFDMNVPSASHHGGAWERQIRTVRSVLNTMLQTSARQLDDESLRTLMYEVTAIVNSRPLSVDDLDDPTSLEPITPNMLLTLKSDIMVAPPGEFPEQDLMLRKRWRRVQHLANVFWQRWRKEYLANLQPRQKWNRPQSNLEEDDIVLIKDENSPRNQWRLGRIVETFPSDDNLVRTVKIIVGDPSLDDQGKRVRKTTYLERPVQKLVLIQRKDRDPGIPVQGANQ